MAVLLVTLLQMAVEAALETVEAQLHLEEMLPQILALAAVVVVVHLVALRLEEMEDLAWSSFVTLTPSLMQQAQLGRLLIRILAVTRYTHGLETVRLRSKVTQWHILQN